MRPLDRLKQEYKELLKHKHRKVAFNNRNMGYKAMRLFCLDCELLTFNEIELMEFEVNNKNQ
jgi:hypothetical protein